MSYGFEAEIFLKLYVKNRLDFAIFLHIIIIIIIFTYLFLCLISLKTFIKNTNNENKGLIKLFNK